MTSNRVEKLRSIAEEMQIAFFLTQHLTEPFHARTLARHILIRAENFIEHARGLRRPLNIATNASYHIKKEAYAANFDEYFKDARHRLSAHVQDLDFGTRIELWKDIEVVKAKYFVEGAQEIYGSLAPFNPPGYVPYSAPVEVSDDAIQQILRQIQVGLDNRNWIEMGTDPLAMTRGNTAAVLTFSSINGRAGQLALIRRWIAIERDLIKRLQIHERIVRILKARLITDVVSFCDCLVTRPVAPGALQQMDGLDKLLAAAAHSVAPITDFVAASNFQAELQAARTIRDKFGAHLEIDETLTIASLAAMLDAFDFENLIAFYDRVSAVFNKVCHSTHFLVLFAADGQRLFGVTANVPPPAPYIGESPATTASGPSVSNLNDEGEYRKNFTAWVDGDDQQKGAARKFFYDAFGGSDTVEEIVEVEDFGVGQRHHKREFRRAHRFILETLNTGLTDNDFVQTLELLRACSGGWRYPISEVLVRYGQTAATFHQWAICYVLGEIGSHPHGAVDAFLERLRAGSVWALRFRATVARFKIYVGSEGLSRINPPRQAIVDFDERVGSLLSEMSENQQLLTLLSFASVMVSSRLNAYLKPFEKNYAELRQKIEALCTPLIFGQDSAAKITSLKELLQTYDYVGISVLLATSLDGGESNSLYEMLLEACLNDSITVAPHDQANRHFVMCLYLKKEFDAALQIAEQIAGRHPDIIEYQILFAQIMGEIVGSEAQAVKKVAEIRRAYTLNATQDGLLRLVEAEISSRQQQAISTP